MPNILAIESSASLCSLALSSGDKVFSREQQGQRSHTQFMLSFVDELLNDADISINDLDAIAFSAGPGSFTGIRLAASTAKALAFAADIPVIAVSSLAIMAQGYYRQTDNNSNCMIITDARMDELYVGRYSLQNHLATAVSEDALVKIAEVQKLTINTAIIGDAEPLLHALSHFSTADFISIEAHAIDILPLACELLGNGEGASALEAEAIYLRGKDGWKTTEQQLAEKANNKT